MLSPPNRHAEEKQLPNARYNEHTLFVTLYLICTETEKFATAMILHVFFCSLCTMAMLYYLLTTEEYYNKYTMTLPTREPFDAPIHIFIILESSQRENKIRGSIEKRHTLPSIL